MRGKPELGFRFDLSCRFDSPDVKASAIRDIAAIPRASFLYLQTLIAVTVFPVRGVAQADLA